MGLAQKITVIPARRTIGTQKAKEDSQKTRVAAYCRVSTEYEEQESSYEMQVQHYNSYIQGNPDWEFAGVYADDGISGTNTAKRESFNRMIDDCKAGKIDMILTKSISRFSRNTVDCLKYTRELKTLNIAVFFEKENINTLDSKGEVLMTIMAALAQQESESISANVRLGIQFRNQQGKVRVNHNRFLGYTKDEDGKLIIVPEEAEIVRRIYAEYMDGKTFLQIRRGLEKDGIKNGAGNTKWWESNIRQILTNEKYIGDALLQKTYTVSVLEKKRSQNDGNLPKYYVEGCHEAIIDKDVFLRVQAEIKRRSNLITDGKKRVYSGKYALSGIVICGHCGDVFRRIKWNNRGVKSTVWRCASRVEKNGPDCPARTLKEEELKAAVVTAVNDAWTKRESVLPMLKENILAVIGAGEIEKISQVDQDIKEKQEELLKAGRDEEIIESIGDEILNLREEKHEIMMESALKQEQIERMEDMTEFLDKQVREITKYSEALVRRLIEKITVYDEKVVVEFKSGLAIEVDG
ncbi:recombinase family protein [Megasphaera vaginalis (ex Srinivasan et al. 2021)]|uniref:Recombinase n=2 Tax=root TaxID=1 RepID=U7UL07_9FIRM|nr:recombinase family protein [Megasphaera vaginalis (ex Srinivasan et al. 2021)]ERT59986.1 recombinase [Megasphaera vaginalis (ex Srinivasan et al. 2021)]DAF86028.1 MAG TPA: integrase [Siphoviridae sp. ctr0c13]